MLRTLKRRRINKFRCTLRLPLTLIPFPAGGEGGEPSALRAISFTWEVLRA
jgi:hypothetical protein